MPGTSFTSGALAQANRNLSSGDPDTYMFGGKANKNYLARVYQTTGASGGAQGQLVARGYLPETFSIGVSSEWSEPFANVSAGQLADAVQLVTNMRPVSQAMTMQVWQGTAPVRFNMRFHFVAYSDAYMDVVQPVERLMRLTVPFRKAGGILVPPGPNVQWLQGIASQFGGGQSNAPTNLTFGSSQQNANSSSGETPKVLDNARGKISLAIGRFLWFENVVVESVDTEFDTAFTSEGFPISARTDITFKTFTVLTQGEQNENGQASGVNDDITKLFSPPQQFQNQQG